MESVDVEIPAGEARLSGTLTTAAQSRAIVLFAHGSGSSRLSPRNQKVARVIQAAGISTLLFDLLTPPEEDVDRVTATLRFDIPFLAGRLVQVTEWLAQQAPAQDRALGYFGASTGAAAALVAAAQLGERIGAVVSRGGRPDLALDVLDQVQAPTLLIVGERDDVVIEMNRSALAELRCRKEMVIVPRATHLFEEPGALEQVASLARDWFITHLQRRVKRAD
ncbi:MAG TPA: alpha/beta family hydrolase [Burkholderiaceae bacterium]|nr:alpha/beta family hydrolase [Burkholderiaceae bacterium]